MQQHALYHRWLRFKLIGVIYPILQLCLLVGVMAAVFWAATFG